MFCSQCGESNEENAPVCTKCGAQLAVAKPAGAKKIPRALFTVLGCGGLLILSMLAAIAIPNFLEFQTRAKVSRALNDMRSMATGIEAYFIDNQAYPAWAVGADSVNGSYFPSNPSFMLSSSTKRLETITTPIQYIEHYYPDPFIQKKGTTFNYYCDNEEALWMLWSAGPDRRYNTDRMMIEAGWENIIDWTTGDFTPEFIRLLYDPTNGTTSYGDIIRLKN